MSLYEDLARESWETGEYSAPSADAIPESARHRSPAGVDSARRAAHDADAGASAERESLRSFLRSKMEWIVEREAYAARGAEIPREEPKMKLAQYVKFREEKFGGVLFETRSEKVFTLSPTGAAVVKEIIAGGGEKEIMARLQAKYQSLGNSIAGDGAEFIAGLKEKGLIVE